MVWDWSTGIGNNKNIELVRGMNQVQSTIHNRFAVAPNMEGDGYHKDMVNMYSSPLKLLEQGL